MAVLETVVRPYASPNTAPGQRYVASGQKSNDPVLIMIGRSGSGKMFQGHASSKFTFYCDAAENETHSS